MGAQLQASCPALPASSMTGVIGEACGIEAKQFHGCGKAFGRWSFEDYGWFCLHRQPCILPKLLLELPRRPAGIAERNQYIIQARAFTLAQCLKNVFRCGEPKFAIDGRV